MSSSLQGDADIFKEVRENKDFAKAADLIPYAKFLGITFSEENDQLIFKLPFIEKNIGNTFLPAIHGGVIGGFLENAAVMHLMWTMESASMPKIIDINIDYMLSGRPETTFSACEIVKQGKRIANVQIKAWQSDPEKPIAIARSHFKVTL